MAYFLIKPKTVCIVTGDYTTKRPLMRDAPSVLPTAQLGSIYIYYENIKVKFLCGFLVSAKRLKTACFGLGIGYLVTNTWVKFLSLAWNCAGFYKIDIGRRCEFRVVNTPG